MAAFELAPVDRHWRNDRSGDETDPTVHPQSARRTHRPPQALKKQALEAHIWSALARINRTGRKSGGREARDAALEFPTAPRRGREQRPSCSRPADRRNTSRSRSVFDDAPLDITATRSHTCAATRRSCVMNSIARLSRSRISSSSASTCACTDTSSADTASSAIRRSGSIASARAMQMRWRWPPENWCG